MTRLRSHVVLVFLLQAAWGLESPPEPTTASGVYVSEENVTLLENESRLITCASVGYPVPTLEWEKVDGEFRDGVRQVGNNLLIPYAQKEDQGVYVCRGIVNGIEFANAYCVVNVVGDSTDPTPVPENVGVTVSERRAQIPIGESISITCTPTGNPLPTVKWEKAYGEFREGVRQSGNNLLIPYAQEEDQGVYVCSGIVDGIEVADDYTVVEILDDSTDPTPGLGNIDVTVSESRVEIPLGDSRIIICTPKGDPLPEVEWNKVDGEFRDGVKQIGNNLIIPYAQEEDQGIYVCSGVVDGTVVADDYSIVEIVESPLEPTTSGPRGNPKVTVSERQVEIIEGENKTITCTPEGSPLPRVQWAKANGEFREGVKQEGNTLVISYAQKDDTAHYVCRGIVEGTTVRSDYTVVSVVDKPPQPTPGPGHPKVTILEREVQIPQGETKTLTCTPEGSPLPRVQWAKANGEFRDGVRQEGNTLVISEARPEDEANYVCRGIIEETTVWTDYARVEVVEPPPKPNQYTVTVSEREVQLKVGERRAIVCLPKGSPLPRVQWLRADGDLGDGVVQQNNVLFIINARKEDQGHYVCRGIVDGTVVGEDYSKVTVF